MLSYQLQGAIQRVRPNSERLQAPQLLTEMSSWEPRSKFGQRVRVHSHCPKTSGLSSSAWNFFSSLG
ncbi:hypothetical protein B0T18DRAFT_399855, partial [Schizothecium vesticola]